MLLTLLFSFVLNIFGHHFSGTTEKSCQRLVLLIYIALNLIIAASCYSNGSISKSSFYHYRHYKGLWDFLSRLAVLSFGSLILYSRARVPAAFVHFLSKVFPCQQGTMYFCEQKLWSRQLSLTQSICSLLFCVAGTLFLFHPGL